MYKFNCLPFGLATAPRVFTKLRRPVVGFLRSHEIHCVTYLDDILIMHQDKKVVVEHTATVIGLLEALGFLINYPKSQLELSQIIDFLGFIVDSLKRELRLPQVKISQVRQEARSLLRTKYMSARNLAQLLGKMSAAVLTIHPAPLHYRELQNLKHRAMRSKGYKFRDRDITRSKARPHLVDQQSQSVEWKLVQKTPEVSIEIDASCSGWEAFCQGERVRGVCWDQEESYFHINTLEMLAVFYAKKAFMKDQEGVSIIMSQFNV